MPTMVSDVGSNDLSLLSREIKTKKEMNKSNEWKKKRKLSRTERFIWLPQEEYKHARVPIIPV